MGRNTTKKERSGGLLILHNKRRHSRGRGKRGGMLSDVTKFGSSVLSSGYQTLGSVFQNTQVPKWVVYSSDIGVNEKMTITSSIAPTLNEYNSMIKGEKDKIIESYLSSQMNVEDDVMERAIYNYKTSVTEDYDAFIEKSKEVESIPNNVKKIANSAYSAYIRLESKLNAIKKSPPVSGGGRNRRGKSKKRGGRW